MSNCARCNEPIPGKRSRSAYCSEYCRIKAVNDGSFVSVPMTDAEKKAHEEGQRKKVDAFLPVEIDSFTYGGVCQCANYTRCSRVISAAQVGNLCPRCEHEARIAR